MSDLCIIGAGHSGGKLVNNLQKLNYNKKILVFSEENYFPYERPPLSKDFLADNKKEKDLEIEINLKNLIFHFNTKINKIDFKKKLLFDENNKIYPYKKLVLANGTRPIKIPFIDDQTGHVLRNIDDSIKIREKIIHSKNIVLIGAGYISLEVSSTIKTKYPDKDVIIIDKSEKILSRNSNDDLRNMILDHQTKNNVKFMYNKNLKKINKDKDNKLITLIFDKDEEITCDLLILGIGVQPNIEILRESEIFNLNGVEINEYCETAIKNVYAIGDITLFKNKYLDQLSDNLRQESWNNAEKQSLVLAKNLIGNRTIYDEIPWFWTEQFEQNYQILGNITNFDKKVNRQYSAQRQSILYIKNKKIVGAISKNSGRDISIIRKIIKKNSDIFIDFDEIKKINYDLRSLI